MGGEGGVMKWTCGVVVVDVIPKHSCFFRGEIWRVVPAAPVNLHPLTPCIRR